MKAQEAMEEMEDSSKPSHTKTKASSLESGSSVKSIFQLLVHHLLMMRFRF